MCPKLIAHCQLPKLAITIAHNSVTNAKKSWDGFSGKVKNNASVNHVSDLFSNQKSVVTGL